MYDHSLVGKYCYKHIPMVVANSPNIFQQKMNDLFHRIKFIPVYIDDLLVLTKLERTYHVQNLELTINKLK